MHKTAIVLIVGAGGGPIADVARAETVWRDETPEAAERQLEKMRAAAGKLERFEVECLMSNLDTAFLKDEQWHIHVYADEIDGYQCENRPVDVKHRSARRKARGDHCELATRKPETWVVRGDTCTALQENERTYQTMSVGPKSWLAPLKTAPHQLLPPWLDPSVDWRDLKSRYKIKLAKSTDSEFFVELSLLPQKDLPWFRWNRDDRLDSAHGLIIDRRTNLPTQWRMVDVDGNRDRIVTFERIDLRPAKRELKVVLSGYQDAERVSAAARKSKPQRADDGEPLRTIQFVAWCVRLLLCPL